jgi:hypothetical protein
MWRAPGRHRQALLRSGIDDIMAGAKIQFTVKAPK